MHKGRAKFSLYGVLLAAILVVAVTSINLMRPAQKASAADISSSYTFNHLKAGGTGWITGIVTHPTTPNLVYGRADVGGLYKWDEGSQTWTQLLTSNAVPNVNSDDYLVESVAVSKTNDQIVYAAVGITWDFGAAPTGRILKSTDQGKTWKDNGQRWRIHGNADFRQQSERLVVDPNNENTVYFGSRTEGLWRTTDGGQKWTQVSTDQVPLVYDPKNGSPAGDKVVVFDPTSGTVNGVTRRLYVGVAGIGIFATNDGGNSWSNIYPTSQVIMSADVGGDGNAYFSITDGHLQRYTPGSNSWKDISPAGNPNYLTISVDPFNAQRLIAANSPVSGGHLYRSGNSGDSWDTLQVALNSPDIPWVNNSDEGNYLSLGNIIFDGTVRDRIWFSQGVGVWRTNNPNGSTVTWDFVSKGIEESVSTDVIAPPGGNTLTTIWDRQGFYYDGGVNQYPQKPLVNEKFSTGWDLDYSGQHPQFIVAAVSDHRFLNPDYSGYSTDGGKSFHVFSGTSTFDDRFAGNIAISATDTNTIVRLPTAGRAPYVSNDQGASWKELTFFKDVKGLHAAYFLGQRKALASDKVDGSFYIYSTEGAFYRSSNNGQDWEKTAGTPQGGGDAWVFGETVAAPGHAGNVWVNTAQGGLSYTENKGDSWTKVSAVQEAYHFGFGKELDGASYPTIYLDGKINDQRGIWRSSDKGATWDLVTVYPLGLYDNVQVVNGDMNVAGRVYIGFGGNGFVYGDTGDSGATNPTPPPSTGSVADGRYEIINRNSGSAMDDAAWGGAGTTLIQWQQAHSSNQRWNVAATGSGYYKITSDFNGLSFTVDGGSTSAGGAIIIQPYTGGDEQLWQLSATDNGYFKIVNKKSGLVIGVTGGSKDNGTPLIQWSANGSPDQEWKFQSA